MTFLVWLGVALIAIGVLGFLAMLLAMADRPRLVPWPLALFVGLVCSVVVVAGLQVALVLS